MRFCLILLVIAVLIQPALSMGQSPTPAITADNAHEVMLQTQYGQGRPYAVDWSPDGRTLLIAETRGIRVIAEDGTIAEIASTHGRARSIAFSSEGSLIVGGFEDGSIVLYDAQNLTPIRTLSGHARPVVTLAFNEAGTQLLSGSGAYLAEDTIPNFENNIAQLWNVEIGELIDTFGAQGIREVAFSPDNSLLAILGSQPPVRHLGFYESWYEFLLYGIPDYQRVISIDNKPLGTGSENMGYERYGISISSDSRWIALPGDPDVLILDAENQQIAVQLTIDDETLRYVDAEFTPDGERLIALSAAPDGSAALHVWSTHEWQLIESLLIENGASAISLSPAGDKLAILQGSDLVRVLAFPDISEIMRIDDYSGQITDLAFSGDGTHIIAGEMQSTTSTGGLFFWEDGTRYLMGGFAESGVQQIATARAGSVIVSRHSDGQFRIWDNTGDDELIPVVVENPYGNDHPGFVLSPDGKWLTIVVIWNEFNIVDTQSGELVATTSDPEQIMHYRPDGLLLLDFAPYLVFGVNRAMQPFAYDFTQGGIAGDEATVWQSIILSTDGDFLVYTDGQMITLWDLVQDVPAMQIVGGALVSFIYSSPPLVTCLTFNQDNSILAFGSNDGAVHLMRIPTGEKIAELRGVTGRVMSIAFNPDGTALAVGDSGGLITLWAIP